MKKKFLIAKSLTNTNCIKIIYIEKFFITSFSDVQVVEISQAYSKRKLSDEYKMLVSNNSHEEWIDISYNTFCDLKKSKCGKTIEKLRKVYKVNNTEYFVDEYKSILDLKILEINFNSEEEFNNFEQPDWFIKDITNDEKYCDRSLSIIF